MKTSNDSKRNGATFGYQPTDNPPTIPSPPSSGSNIVQPQTSTYSKKNISDALLEILDFECPLVFYDDDHGFCINTQDAYDAILNRLQESEK